LGELGWTPSQGRAVYTSSGWDNHPTTFKSRTQIVTTLAIFPSARTITEVSVILSNPLNGNAKHLQVRSPDISSTQFVSSRIAFTGTDTIKAVAYLTGGLSVTGIFIDIINDENANGTAVNAFITSVSLRGTGPSLCP